MNRREFREHTFCLLFSSSFHGSEDTRQAIDLYLENLTEMDQEELEERQMPKIPVISQEEADELEQRIPAILSYLNEIDRKINAASDGWPTSRMNRVDLTIIRLAVYEMNYEKKVPVKVAINEAVEIAKKYGGPSSPSFINGVLAKLVETEE